MLLNQMGFVSEDFLQVSLNGWFLVVPTSNPHVQIRVPTTTGVKMTRSSACSRIILDLDISITCNLKGRRSDWGVKLYSYVTFQNLMVSDISIERRRIAHGERTIWGSSSSSRYPWPLLIVLAYVQAVKWHRHWLSRELIVTDAERKLRIWGRWLCSAVRCGRCVWNTTFEVLALLQSFRYWLPLCLHIFVVARLVATVDTRLVCCPLYLRETFSDGIIAESRNVYITCISDGAHVQRNIGTYAR
jgi:hypothetical protein